MMTQDITKCNLNAGVFRTPSNIEGATHKSIPVLNVDPTFMGGVGMGILLQRLDFMSKIIFLSI